jgi:hypothetical protein
MAATCRLGPVFIISKENELVVLIFDASLTRVKDMSSF